MLTGQSKFGCLALPILDAEVINVFDIENRRILKENFHSSPDTEGVLRALKMAKKRKII